MADGYKAGDLNLSVRTSADDTIKYLDAVIERLNFIDKGLNGISKKTAIGKSSSSGNSKSSKNGDMFGFAKMGTAVYLARRLGKELAGVVQAGSDYTETLNLWQVAMRNNLDMADEFISKMNTAYGISEKNLMNAQATFKNMIGSLGQISDETAYQLSEALVQMSADYASLYNRTLDSAIQNMQSMLAGQVRPIRSAGLDITETTLYQFYQELGGTKAMRQLNRTEKQLLSILAVYKQMGSAGALGDMTKTLNTFANQSRMMSEYWAQLKTWSGLILKDWLEQGKVLVYINATLITITEIIKAIAKSKGIGEDNFISDLYETTEATIDEVDKLQGKLLGFDKFRALEDTEQEDVSLDSAIIDAIAGYSSVIDQAQNAAQQMAEDWLAVFGFTKDANGEFIISQENLEKLSDTLEAIATTVGVIVGHKLADWLITTATSAGIAAAGFELLKGAITFGIVYAFLEAIEAFKDGDEWLGILYTSIGALLTAFILLKSNGIAGAITGFGKLITAGLIANTVTLGLVGGILATTIGLLAMGTAAGLAFYVFANWETMNGIEKTISIIGVLTVALLGAAVAFGAFHSAWSLGLAIAGIAAGIAAVVIAVKQAKKDIDSIDTTTFDIPNYATGASDIDSGTVFRAGEFGKTEAVYTGSNGKTNVANIQQMKQAELQALQEWWSTAKNDIPQFSEANPTGLYQAVTGVAKSYGNKWDKY